MAGPSVKAPVDWLDSEVVEDVGPDAAMFMLSALGWSARQTTDGFVPTRAFRKLYPVADVADSIGRLEEAGQLEVRDDGIYFPAWRDFLLPSEEVERMREQTRVRTQRARRHAAGDHSMCSPTRGCGKQATVRSATGSATHGVSHADPTRTDPTRTDPKEVGTGSVCSICSQPEDMCRSRERTSGHAFTARSTAEPADRPFKLATAPGSDVVLDQVVAPARATNKRRA